MIFPFCACIIEEIGIKTEEERELILSEIYELAHFDEESVLESEIQGMTSRPSGQPVIVMACS